MTTLSTVEFEVYWDRLGLGALPPVLDMPSPGRTHEERQWLSDSVCAGLRARGPAADQLARNLAVLGDFTWAVDTRIVSTTLVRARGAVSGRRGVLAVLRGDVVTVERMPEHGLLAAVVALAGVAPASRGESVSVRADALDTATALAAGDPHTLAQGLITLGERADDARAVARLYHGAHTRGQFAGRPGGAAIGFHDTPVARYLHLRGNGWVTLMPAAALLPHVRQLTAETARR